MREILPEELPHIEPYYRYANLFSPPECAEIIRIAESNGMAPGTIGIGMGQAPVLDENYRCASTSRILDSQAPWLFERLIERTKWVNQEYKFDLHGLYEDVGVMRYMAPADDKPAGRYRWHQDFGGGPFCRRKISIVGLLSNPADFTGGDLRMFTNGDNRVDLNQQGDTVLFPSWAPHCVTDVTKGIRYSLVAWVSGARFR